MPAPQPTSTPAVLLPHGAPSWRIAITGLVLAGAVSWGLISTGAAPREAGFMSGIFVLALLLWVTEAIPLFATSLLVIGLQALLLANPGNWPGLGFESGESPSYRDIFNIAADPVLLLFFGGFVLAQAAVNEGVDRSMSLILLKPFGGKPRQVLLGMMLVTLTFSMWMSNTATAAMMLALATPLLAALPPGEPFRKALLLGIAFSANIGGMSTPISSPPNAVAVGFLADAGYAVTFLDWMLVAIPLAVFLTLFSWWLLYRIYKPVASGLRLALTSEPLCRRGWLVVCVFTITVLLWMSDQWHGLPASVVALFPAIVLTGAGVFTREDLGRLEWRILILIAGGISLGMGLQMTGLDVMISAFLPTSGSGIWLLTVLVAATLIIGTFMSNTAAANLFLPLGISSATAVAGGGLHPVQMALSIAMVASMTMMLPISTPPNALAYSRGEFTSAEMARTAILISLTAAVLIVLTGGFIMEFWGVLK